MMKKYKVKKFIQIDYLANKFTIDKNIIYY